MIDIPNRITIVNSFCHGGLATTFPSEMNADTNLVDGFTAKSVGSSSGGVTHTVKREDFNGIGKLATKMKLYLQSGGISRYNSSIGSTSGYPKGAVVFVDSGERIYKLMSTISHNKNVPSIVNGVPSTGWANAGDYTNFSLDWSGVNSESDNIGGPISGTWTKKYGTDKFVSNVWFNLYQATNPVKGYYGQVSGKLTIKFPNGSSYVLKEYPLTSGNIYYDSALGFVKKNTTIQFTYYISSVEGKSAIEGSVSYGTKYYKI